MGELYNVVSERSWSNRLIIKPTLGHPGGGPGPVKVYKMTRADRTVTVKGTAVDLADLAPFREAAEADDPWASVTDQHGQVIEGDVLAYQESTSNENPLIQWSLQLREG